MRGGRRKMRVVVLVAGMAVLATGCGFLGFGTKVAINGELPSSVSLHYSCVNAKLVVEQVQKGGVTTQKTVLGTEEGDITGAPSLLILSVAGAGGEDAPPVSCTITEPNSGGATVTFACTLILGGSCTPSPGALVVTGTASSVIVGFTVTNDYTPVTATPSTTIT